LRSVAAVTRAAAQTFARGPGREAESSSRLVGTLVHRLLQRMGFSAAASGEIDSDAIVRMCRPDEVATMLVERTVQDLADEVLESYRAICQRPDVQALYAEDRLHEVPFTMRVDGAVIRGQIDCLVLHRTGITILEFKTGRPRDEHRLQLDLYRQAAELVFPGVPVDARLVYATA
jgi:ATP-dependent exoDNAse (exonuclease V) beta subunit